MRSFATALTLVVLASCGDDDAANGKNGKNAPGSGDALPPCTNCTPAGPMTFRLPSPAGATLWTTTTMDKVVREAAPPDNPGEAIEMSAAKNEFEPFQIVVRPDAGSDVTLAMPAFGGPGSIPRIEIRRVGYVKITESSDATSIKSGYVPDPLEPTTFGATEHVDGTNNQPFWITVYVPPDAPAGDYTSTLTVTVGGGRQDIPVKLHVYDFALPSKIGFDGNWNVDFKALGGGASLDKVQELKTWMYEHRLTPGSVSWPAGLNYNGGIEYDCASGSFKDNPSDVYDFSQLGPKYIDGQGWNGAGFPSFEALEFVDNSTPRPQKFCDVDIGPDAYGTEAYNAAWSKLLAAMDAYVVAHHWEDKAYYYVQNEPQDQNDADVAAALAKLSKTAAPHLRIAISEEPKAQIAENPKAGGKSYDLWWADLSAFDPDYAKKRQDAGETVWWYFLYGDQPPHFNPITIDHSGIESRVPYFAAYKYGIKGFAYYSVTGWGDDPYNNPRPAGTKMNGDGFMIYPPKDGQLVSSIRWELLREGQEDYEYLLLAKCRSSAESVASSTTAYSRDASAIKHLRDELGLLLEHKVDGCPALAASAASSRKRGEYYVNFQDPAGEPKADPLVVDGHTWIKVGWSAYDPAAGFGWSGENIGKPDIMKYTFLDAAGVNDLQKSIIFDDYGRTDTFAFDIENGKYTVTVSIGFADRTYAKNKVIVEGQTLFDNVETNPGTPYIVKSVDIDVTDGNVTMEAGQKDEYTMLNWMSVVPK